MNGSESQTLYTYEDIQQNKLISALAYLIFFLPLIVCPDSPYGKFHANQGLILFILSFVGGFVLGIIPIIGWALMPIFWLAILVFAILGIVNAFNGKAKELPLIGKYTLLK
jgi:uncharacterized membrane protein